jgi:protein-S-isoprenylcysteine O-methyltransferase Ste14
VVACGPYVWVLYRDVDGGVLQLTRALLIIEVLLWIGTMTLRFAPVRVTRNPLYWALAFLATYWPFLILEVTDSGRAVVADWVSGALGITGLVLAIYARLSLGRNVGIVPAQRQLVFRGAYRFVRHPIYSALALSTVAALLRQYSAVNLAVVVIGTALYMLKSLVEEGFLASDADYRSYMEAVRWRWVPGVI